MSFVKRVFRLLSNPGELVHRLEQQLWNFRRRVVGPPRTRELTVSEEFGHRFFAGPTEVEAVVARLILDSEYCRKVISRAEKVIEGRYDLLGYGDLRFGEGGIPDWHYDPVRNKAVPVSWWKESLQSMGENNADPKVIWELNRHQFLVTLGIAYRLTGEDQYRAYGLRLLESWMDRNPLYRGINWASSLELSFRCISWIWAGRLFNLGNEWPCYSQFLQFLYLQGEYVENNLSTYHSPNTHITGEALGLVHLGLLFGNQPFGKRWLEKGAGLLISYLPVHVLEDGGYVEGTLWYHKYTIDIYCIFMLLGRRFDLALGKAVDEAVVRLGDFLVGAMTPDRRFPLFGDDDGGALLLLGGEGADNDLRVLFSSLACCFQRAEYGFAAAGFQPESLWLFGVDGERRFADISPAVPVERKWIAKSSGFSFLRTGWEETDMYLAFDHARFGWLNCGHAHADQLSFELRKGTRKIVADPGTYTYHGTERNIYRGAEVHATVMINGIGPASPSARPFHWDRFPDAPVFRYNEAEGWVKLQAELLYPNGIVLRRTIFFLDCNCLLLEDVLLGSGDGVVEHVFPLGETGWKPTNDGNCIVHPDIQAGISWESGNRVELQLANFMAAPVYGGRQPALLCRLRRKMSFPGYVTVLFNCSTASLKLLRDGFGEGSVVHIVDTQRQVLATVPSAFHEA